MLIVEYWLNIKWSKLILYHICSALTTNISNIIKKQKQNNPVVFNRQKEACTSDYIRPKKPKIQYH